MNDDSLYAFYGSLRCGLENYQAYGNGALRHLHTCRIAGFRMYSMGSYPYAIRSFNEEQICVELFRITDQAVERAIHEMELEAEYYYDEVEIDGRKFGIYLFRQERPGDLHITDGDWKDFVLSRGV